MKPPNRLFLWSFPLLAIAAAVVTYMMAVSGADRSSEDVMRDFEADLALGGPSMDSALFKIDMAFKLALSEGDREQQALILKRRSKLYRDLRRPDRAREDLELLIEEYAPEDLDAIRTLARLEFDNDRELDALARIEKVLEENPFWEAGRTYRAEFRYETAISTMLECDLILSDAMDDAKANRARYLTRSAASRLPSDPRRAALVYEITQLFPTGAEQERREYFNLFARASTLLNAAYSDNSTGLERSNSVNPMLGILRLLSMAREFDQAGSFADATLTHFAKASSEFVQEKYLEFLSIGGREEEADNSLSRFRVPGRSFSIPTLKEALRIYSVTESWAKVNRLASELEEVTRKQSAKLSFADVAANTSLSQFYRGIASHHLGSHRDAANYLRGYYEAIYRAQPYPAAARDAQFALARSARTLPEPIWRKFEANALSAALHSSNHAHPDDWLKLLELQRASNLPPAVFENTIANVMASSPNRSAELEAEWRAAGKRAVRASVLSRTSAPKSSKSSPLRRPDGPFVIFARAEKFASQGEWYSTLSACEQLFSEVPYFTPAVELYLQACFKLDLHDRGIELLLGRLEYLENHPPTVARLNALADYFTPAQKIRLISTAPTRIGRNLLVRELLRSKRYEEARLAFSSEPIETLFPEDNLQLGEAQLGLGLTEEALISLRRVPTTSPHYPSAFGLLLQAALEFEDSALIDATISQLAHPTAPIASDLIPIHDQLLIAGEIGLASKVSTYLDSDASTRSGRNMLRLAALQMQSGDLVSALESLERAYAYLADGGPTIGQILIAIQNEDWDSIPPLIGALDEENPKLEVQSRMALELLRGRSQVVLEYLAGLDRDQEAKGVNLLLRALTSMLIDPTTPVLEEFDISTREETETFLRGSINGFADPRRVLGLILALQHPDWHAWLVQELPKWNEYGSLMWSDYLQGELLLRMGALSKADEKISRLVTRWPNFLSGWELASRLQLMRPRDDADLVRFAKEGWRAPGHPRAIEMREAVERIRVLREQGDLEGALQLTRTTLDTNPESSALLYQLGKIYQDKQLYSQTLVALNRFVKSLGPEARNAIMPEVIAVIDEATTRGQMDYELRRQTLRGLTKAFPRNALVALELAECEIEGDLLDNPTAALQNAYDQLDQFRELTGYEPLRDLGQGGLAAWHDFYQKFDPLRGERFLRKELELSPSDPELWAMLADSMYAQGRYLDADRQLDFVLAVAPGTRCLELRVKSLIRRNRPYEEVEQALDMLANLVGYSTEHPEYRYWRGLAKSRVSKETVREGLDELEELWKNRTQPEMLAMLEKPLEYITRLGHGYGVAAMRNGNRDDHVEAQKVFQTLSSLNLSPNDQRFYATLSHIGPHRSSATVPEVKVKLPGQGGRQPRDGANRPVASAAGGQAGRAGTGKGQRPGPGAQKGKQYTEAEREEHKRKQAARALEGKGASKPAAREKGLPQVLREEHRRALEGLEQGRYEVPAGPEPVADPEPQSD